MKVTKLLTVSTSEIICHKDYAFLQYPGTMGLNSLYFHQSVTAESLKEDPQTQDETWVVKSFFWGVMSGMPLCYQIAVNIENKREVWKWWPSPGLVKVEQCKYIYKSDENRAGQPEDDKSEMYSTPPPLQNLLNVHTLIIYLQLAI